MGNCFGVDSSVEGSFETSQSNNRRNNRNQTRQVVAVPYPRSSFNHQPNPQTFNHQPNPQTFNQYPRPQQQRDFTEVLRNNEPNNILRGSFVSQNYSQNVISINGQLQYDKNKRISSYVFEGLSSDRKVAVKIDRASKIDREIKILSSLDHQNIVRFFFECTMSDGQKVLISEFYERPLSDCSKLQIDFKSIMHQLASALEHLQRKKILHLDVSPGNIFSVKRDNENVVKLTNFEKAQKNLHGCVIVDSFDSEFSAPEVKVFKRAYGSSDFYSLGLVFVYIMLKMGHGKAQKAQGRKNQAKSVKLTLDVAHLKNDSNDLVLAKKLCEKLSNENFNKRMTENILEDPFFWSASRTLHFIVDVAKMLEGNNNDFRTEIFKGSQKVIGGKDAEWTSWISNKLLDKLKDARKAYCARTGSNNDEINGKSITSLITTIRNMIVHTKSNEVTAIVGKDDEAFVKYWTSRFPNLILHLYETKLKCEKEN